MTKRDKTTVDDIIGIVHTDETTNSVEEVKKLRGRTNDRFIVDTAGTLIDIETRNNYDYVSEVCPLLNDIDSENTHVKYSLAAHMVDLNNCKGKCSALEEENEQLKSTVKEVLGLLSDEVDLFSDKATEHDINAYVELKELDNKDAYYMATATKKAIKILKGCLND